MSNEEDAERLITHYSSLCYSFDDLTLAEVPLVPVFDN